MQSDIILGMLSLKPMSIYELKKAMEKSTAMFYTTSIGAIHPACQKLTESGYIACRSEYEGKREKKIYSITPAGRKEYQRWLISPLETGKIREELLVRLFFFSEADDAWRGVVGDYLGQIRAIRAGLLQKRDEAGQVKLPKEYLRRAHFQLATLDFGIDYYRFLEEWLMSFLAKKVPR